MPGDPREIRIGDYHYHLPAERIAAFPMADRDGSKLLVYSPGTVPAEDRFANLHRHLPGDALLVLNDTRVVYARLLFAKPTGARVEIFCLSPLAPQREWQRAFGLPSPVTWECLVGNARRWKQGRLEMNRHTPVGRVSLCVEREGMRQAAPGDERMAVPVRFSWEPSSHPFSYILEHFGVVPLPPYIDREPREDDKSRYQTTYARQEGSVAAPTAGLHFTPKVFSTLNEAGIPLLYLTLHVGAGTFRPVAGEKLGDHAMHAEPFDVSVTLIEDLLRFSGRRIIPVGTTSVRTLESLYWLGVRYLTGSPAQVPPEIGQWEPYEKSGYPDFTREEVLQALVRAASETGSLQGFTRLMIAPAYRFRMTDGMITNFHQPGSTLLLLIAAFLGRGWKEAYEFALARDFRFLSYGDSCLFLP